MVVLFVFFMVFVINGYHRNKNAKKDQEAKKED